MGAKLDHILVNPNQMRHNCIGVQYNPCVYNPTGITRPQEDVTIPLYMSGTIVCADISSPTQQYLEDFPWVILTSQHDWDPHPILFPKILRRKEEEYLFTGIAKIHVYALRIKVHDIEIDPWLRNTIHNSSFIETRIVLQVRIADANVPDAARINYFGDDVLEGHRQDIPSHRTLTSK